MKLVELVPEALQALHVNPLPCRLRLRLLLLVAAL
jgi:hypothetical protein